MTADAKVGLLLGLFFIVIIAFLVNGLPNFIQEENPVPPSATITAPTAPDIVLDDRVPEAVHRLPRSRAQRQSPQAQRQKKPQDKLRAASRSTGTPAVPQRSQPELKLPVVVINGQKPIPPVKPVQPKPANVRKVQSHVVKPGESLPVIAKIYYGDEDGNRRVVIQKLYEANASVLKSPDRVFVGNKLVIPELDELLNPSKKVVKAPNASKTLLKKFSNLLERVGEDDAKSISEYVVQEHDSLWSIAQQRLGNGNRYKEIARLNKIKNVDNVVAGVRLKLPAQ